MKANGLTYLGRPLCSVLRPFFITRHQYDTIQATARDVSRGLQQVAQHALDTPSIRAKLGLGEIEEDLLSIVGIDDDSLTVGRLDGFLTHEGGLRLLECNGESPGGIAFGDGLGELFDELPTLKELRRTFNLERKPVVPSVVENFIDRYHTWARRKGLTPSESPTVAILDRANQPTYREFELFAESFESRGMRAIIVNPDELSIESNRLIARSIPIDTVYRRLVTPDLLTLPGHAATLVDAMKQDLVHVGNTFGGHLLSHKGLFAVFSDPKLTPSGMGTDLAARLSKCIPWTRFVTDCPQLTERILSCQERLVLKPVSDYGGHGVVLGWETDEATWGAHVQEAQRGSFIVQERIEAPSATFPLWGQQGLEWRELLYDTCPYLLGRKGDRHGMGVRISEESILNMARGAGSAIPVYIVNPS